ncbi:MAG: 2,3-bisphosphoglycerate-independent phosphoglycerate mutase [Campylobacterota bacterium]
MANKTVLIITDGIGYAPNSACNAFEMAKTPTYDKLFTNTPYSLIHTYGKYVGLPDGQMGNSEVGHMSIGSGRVLYQDLVKISMALQDRSLAHNKALQSIQSDRVHIIGLASDGGVHSHIDHLIGLAKLYPNKQVFMHLITDGRDVDPKSSPSYIQKILDAGLTVATVSGRFYTMDRDNRWERIQKGYEVIANAANLNAIDPLTYIQSQYDQDITDEFIQPASFNGYTGLREGDSIIMANFRTDRVRQITAALGDQAFDRFDREFKAPHIVTMTRYDASFDYPVMFDKEVPQNTLAQVISKEGLTQLHTAETEKYAHVTFFLNGGVEEPFENESRVLIPSPDVKTYDEKPQMSAPQVSQAVRRGMDEAYDFIVVNFANGDMVGHTGNVDAAIKAVEAVDKEVGTIMEKAKQLDYNVVLTSDHGNCEQMKDSAGNMLTNHTVGDVWCFVQAPGVHKVQNGALCNIAPTVLKLMDIEIPKQMEKPLI